jgi:hypothetical protein
MKRREFLGVLGGGVTAWPLLCTADGYAGDRVSQSYVS